VLSIADQGRGAVKDINVSNPNTQDTGEGRICVAKIGKYLSTEYVKGKGVGTIS